MHVAVALWLMIDKVISVGKDAIPTLTLDYCIIASAILGIHTAIQNFIRWPEVPTITWKSVRMLTGREKAEK